MPTTKQFDIHYTHNQPKLQMTCAPKPVCHNPTATKTQTKGKNNPEQTQHVKHTKQKRDF
jgi:hypothetical protein